MTTIDITIDTSTGTLRTDDGARVTERPLSDFREEIEPAAILSTSGDTGGTWATDRTVTSLYGTPDDKFYMSMITWDRTPKEASRPIAPRSGRSHHVGDDHGFKREPGAGALDLPPPDGYVSTSWPTITFKPAAQEDILDGGGFRALFHDSTAGGVWLAAPGKKRTLERWYHRWPHRGSVPVAYTIEPGKAPVLLPSSRSDRAADRRARSALARMERRARRRQRAGSGSGSGS